MKRTLSTIGLAAGLTGAALFGGATLSGIAGAQDSPAQEQPAPDQEAPAPDQAPEDAPRPGGCHGGRHLDTAAEALGLSVDELRAELENGQTIADVAAAQGVDVQTVIDAMVAEAEAHVAEEVESGELSQEEADQKLADLEERITASVNGERPERPDGPPPEGAPEDSSFGVGPEVPTRT